MYNVWFSSSQDFSINILKVSRRNNEATTTSYTFNHEQAQFYQHTVNSKFQQILDLILKNVWLLIIVLVFTVNLNSKNGKDQKTKYGATQLVQSLKFKLSHAIFSRWYLNLFRYKIFPQTSFFWHCCQRDGLSVSLFAS